MRMGSRIHVSEDLAIYWARRRFEERERDLT